ncbi:signal peptidase I [Silvanigrella aquatica]|uniref:Signal peptidase I n=1 Tax=Silvanigrella aquatica TaxID=1915309 RepID=A0A1L4CZQ3_9BACT|nr:signal peptidase I [Silvanigrella aquatica]APJ03443.1 signal peptidase I [Silvanigrella aquatica]
MKKNYVSEFAWVIAFILFFILLKTSVMGFYLVPTPSMLPNIIPGDRVMMNKLSYGLWLPFLDSPLMTWGSPKRGDVVFFESPNGQGTFVKRVIALPGDVVSFYKGIVIINGQQVSQSYMGNSPYRHYQNNVIIEENKDLHLRSHLILMSQEPGSTYFESGRFIVPPHKVFVLGDNRDSSVDSRVFGFVDEKALYGKAWFVLFSTAGNNGLFPEFRTSRFFQRVE